MEVSVNEQACSYTYRSRADHFSNLLHCAHYGTSNLYLPCYEIKIVAIVDECIEDFAERKKKLDGRERRTARIQSIWPMLLQEKAQERWTPHARHPLTTLPERRSSRPRLLRRALRRCLQGREFKHRIKVQ